MKQVTGCLCWMNQCDTSFQMSQEWGEKMSCMTTWAVLYVVFYVHMCQSSILMHSDIFTEQMTTDRCLYKYMYTTDCCIPTVYWFGNMFSGGRFWIWKMMRNLLQELTWEKVATSNLVDIIKYAWIDLFWVLLDLSLLGQQSLKTI